MVILPKCRTKFSEIKKNINKFWKKVKVILNKFLWHHRKIIQKTLKTSFKFSVIAVKIN